MALPHSAWAFIGSATAKPLEDSQYNLQLIPPGLRFNMSEYWVSNKKYFCKYCNIYIADDKPSRTQHESGLRHKGNVERFVRGLYKAGEKRKHDLEEEKREMAQVEKVSKSVCSIIWKD